MFSNVHMFLFGLPAGHKFYHLKRAVLINLFDEREDLVKKQKLGRHLEKTTMTYEEAVMALKDTDGAQPIPPHLGDFILAAISFTIDRVICVVKPNVRRYTDVNNMPKVCYGCEMEYLFIPQDRGAGKGSDLLVVVYNGIDYYAPAVPKYIINLTQSAANAGNLLVDAMSQVESIIAAVPSSGTRTTMGKALQHMGAAKKYLLGTSLATGTTTDADLPKDVPIPKALPMAAAAKVSRKCVASTIHVMPPEKKKNEDEAEFKKWKVTYVTDIAKQAKRSTKMEDNQCACGKTFHSKEFLDNHILNSHPDPNAWQCSMCKSVLGNKEHCWSHIRHHLGKYYHYCDIQYKDDKDDAGEPKIKVCEVGRDEAAAMEFHRETEHKIGHCKIRCQHCKKPMQSQRRKLGHEEICHKGTTLQGEKTHFCDIAGCEYGCRGTATLRAHKKREHSEKVGLAAPRKYICQYCKKVFKTAVGARGHTANACPVKKQQDAENQCM